MNHLGTTRISNPQTPAVQRSFRRRTVLTGLAVLWAGAWARRFQFGVSTVQAEDSQSSPSIVTPPLGATYVGPTSDPETLVGIVLLDNEPGAVVAYLCRGAELNVWFTGHLQDDVLEMAGGPAPETIVDGTSPTLSGRRDDSGIVGEAMLPDRTLTFTAIAAEGIAGLYVTERDGDGMVTGASSTGATLKARQSAATGTVKGIAPFQISGTVVSADGRHFEITIPARTDVAASSAGSLSPMAPSAAPAGAAPILQPGLSNSMSSVPPIQSRARMDTSMGTDSSGRELSSTKRTGSPSQTSISSRAICRCL